MTRSGAGAPSCARRSTVKAPPAQWAGPRVAATLAAQPESPSCFGAGASQLAQSSTGAMGEHSSSFGTPRLGIGNVAELFTDTHQPGLLGIALGADC